MTNSKPLIIFLIFLLMMQSLFASITIGQLHSPVIAVAEFQNATGRQELEFMGNSVPAILTTDLTKTGQITIVERRKINRIAEEQRFSLSGMVDERTAKEVGRLLGADYLVTGAVIKLGSDIRVDVTLINITSGQITGFSQAGRDENVIHTLSESIIKHLAGNDIPLKVKYPHPLYTEDAITQLTALDKPWYKRWYVWGILIGIVVGVAAVSSCVGGGNGGGSGGGGGGGGC